MPTPAHSLILNQLEPHIAKLKQLKADYLAMTGVDLDAKAKEDAKKQKGMYGVCVIRVWHRHVRASACESLLKPCS